MTWFEVGYEDDERTAIVSAKTKADAIAKYKKWMKERPKTSANPEELDAEGFWAIHTIDRRRHHHRVSHMVDAPRRPDRLGALVPFLGGV